MKTVCFILGTRPEIIKLSPVIHLFQKNLVPFFIIHTNQHYSPNMDKAFFRELQLPKPKYNLHIRESLHGKMTGKMIAGIEAILMKHNPGLIIVQGDTNTVLAGALAGAKLQIPIAHVEAGLRSYDRSMPEELNRVLVDHISDFLFCPTQKQATLAKFEGIDQKNIFVTGNTVVDAVQHNLKIAEKRINIKKYLKNKYILLTLHRPSNVDNPKSLKNIIQSLEKVASYLQLPIVFPIHPRTDFFLKKGKIILAKKHFHVLPPVSYLKMLMLEKHAQLILTDSGGMQEEACILRVPCVTLRDNTERPETVTVGANIVAGIENKSIMNAVKIMINKQRRWKNPFGRGNSSQKILNILKRKTE